MPEIQDERPKPNRGCYVKGYKGIYNYVEGKWVYLFSEKRPERIYEAKPSDIWRYVQHSPHK